MKKFLFTGVISLITSIISYSQLCPGGGLTFATAAPFSQSWTLTCPGTGVTHSNLAACEPTTALDACAPPPAVACISGTAGSDLWYVFYAGATSLSIVVNPTFDAAIQAFSGGTCPGLTEIGCVDVGGNGGSETLNLTGLTIGGRYYFRVFGATASAPNRTGTFTFCGTSSTLLQFALPITLNGFSATPVKGNVVLKWTTTSEIDASHIEIERSSELHPFATTARVPARGSSNGNATYTWRDILPDPGMNYYRLKLVDLDGQYRYSTTVPVKINYARDVAILLNPVKDVLLIQARTTMQAFIYNTSGQQVLTFRLQPGRNELPLPALTNGIYYLKTGSSTPEKFIISH